MDDRFDFQLVTDEMRDGEGMSYRSGSYHAFGNNGTHVCCNSAITNGTGAAPNVLTALMQSSDHLPVVADYRIPAMMSVEVSPPPLAVLLGSSIALDVTVTNTASAVIPDGADELDYALSVAGALSGMANGVDAALGMGNVHQVTLNASALGERAARSPCRAAARAPGMRWSTCRSVSGWCRSS